MKLILLNERMNPAKHFKASVAGQRESLAPRLSCLLTLVNSAAGEKIGAKNLAEAMVNYRRAGGSEFNATRALNGLRMKTETLKDFAEFAVLKFIAERTARYISDVEIDKLERQVLVHLSPDAKPHLEEIRNYPLGDKTEVFQRKADARGSILVKYRYENGGERIDKKEGTVNVTLDNGENANVSVTAATPVAAVAPVPPVPDLGAADDDDDIDAEEPAADIDATDDDDDVVQDEDYGRNASDFRFDGGTRALMVPRESLESAAKIVKVLGRAKLDNISVNTALDMMEHMEKQQVTVQECAHRYSTSICAAEVCALVLGEKYNAPLPCDACGGKLLESRDKDGLPVCRSCHTVQESMPKDENVFRPHQLAKALGQQYHPYKTTPADTDEKDTPFPDFKTKKPTMGGGDKDGLAEEIAETCHMCGSPEVVESSRPNHLVCKGCGFFQERDKSDDTKESPKKKDKEESLVIEGATCPKCEGVSTLVPMGETARCLSCSHNLNLDEMRKANNSVAEADKYNGDGDEDVHIDVASHNAKNGDAKTDESAEDGQPEDDDIIIQQKGDRMWALYMRKKIAEAGSEEELYAQIRAWADKNNFSPDVWMAAGERGIYNLRTAEVFKHENKAEAKSDDTKTKKSKAYNADEGNTEPGDSMLPDDKGGDVKNPMDKDTKPAKLKAKKESVKTPTKPKLEESQDDSSDAESEEEAITEQLDDRYTRGAEIALLAERKMKTGNLGLGGIKSEGEGLPVNQGQSPEMPSPVNNATKMPSTDSDAMDDVDDKSPNGDTEKHEGEDADEDDEKAKKEKQLKAKKKLPKPEAGSMVKSLGREGGVPE